ncbi:hypothetical protein MMU07_20335 [Aquiflexum sp. LQ15W]|uniref:hypothetical protein n=1 Tax=Cognataquiflexum nitidum TaxID=2922272 RepID=UPI001F12EEFD|nr:hypothetical protein [Cognataquiflexum nitidum]MCH6201938.1 hypothetical protein [Cognataquiflexum nitidum]
MKKLEKEYVTTRLVEKRSKKAFKEGAKKAMKSNGYVIIAQDGWVVKKYADGKIEKLEQISQETAGLQVIFD